MREPHKTRIAPPHKEGEDAHFEEPWHAEVLAIADALIRADLFTASDWATALGSRLRDAELRGEPDDQPTYYRCALDALELLMLQHAPDVWANIANRVEAWRQAYLRTPHGRPVLLGG